MNPAKRQILQTVYTFIETITCPDEEAQDSRAVSEIVNGLERDLAAYNMDAAQTDSRPFMLVHVAPGTPLAEVEIDKIILAADESGLADQFCKAPVNGFVCGFFGHKATAFVEGYLKAHVPHASYMNMSANGIVFSDFQLVGLYTASRETLTTARSNLSAYLSE
jgi:hypothetical protein